MMPFMLHFLDTGPRHEALVKCVEPLPLRVCLRRCNASPRDSDA
jgi:hypothetical protein